MNGTTNEAAMSFRIYKSEKTCLLRIRGCGPVLVAAQAWCRSNYLGVLSFLGYCQRRGAMHRANQVGTALGGLTTKATISFRMNRIAFYTVRYCGLGGSQRGRRSVRRFRGGRCDPGEQADGIRLGAIHEQGCPVAYGLGRGTGQKLRGILLPQALESSLPACVRRSG